MRVGVPGKGTGASEDAPHSPPKLSLPCDGRKKTAVAAVVRLFLGTPIPATVLRDSRTVPEAVLFVKRNFAMVIAVVAALRDNAAV